MQVKIKATKIELTAEIKELIQLKMDMIEKYLGSVSVSNCDFEIEKSLSKQNHGKIYRAEVNLSVPGEVLRIEKTEVDINKSIEKVKDHLQISIKKYKEKRQDKKRVSYKV